MLLDFLRCLPKEQIQADRGSQNADKQHEVIALEVDCRHQCLGCDLTPWNVDHQQHERVRHEGQRQPFQDGREALIRHEQLKRDSDQAEPQRVVMRGATNDELQRFAHRADVGRDIQGVGHHQQTHDEIEQRTGIVIADIARDAVPGDATDARRHDLNADHQRRREEHAPQHAEAELRTGLRIRRDAAWIVVRGAGNEAGAEAAQECFDANDHGRVLRPTTVDAAAREYSSALLAYKPLRRLQLQHSASG